jgi:pimeloyl-ACP methyl ester carboxylesterase
VKPPVVRPLERWLVAGISGGTTLALASAQAHPERVTEMVLTSVVHVGTYPGHRPDPRYEDPAFRLCFARIVTHYFRDAGFLVAGALLRVAARLAGIPAVMVHGRLEVSGRPDVPWRLARAWPGSE